MTHKVLDINFYKKLSPKRKICFILFALLTISLIVFIFSNSLKNGEDSSADSEWVSEIVAKFINFVFGTNYTVTDIGGYVRTFAHFSEFAALAFCFSCTWLCAFNKTVANFIPTLPFTFSVAVIDEIIQIFSDGRAFQLSDIGVDTLGGLTGIVFLWVILTLFKLLFKKRKQLKKV